MIDAATVQALAGFMAVLLAATGILAGFVYWHIRDLKIEVQRLNDKADRGKEELRTEFRAEVRRLESKIDHNHTEVMAEIRRTREEFTEELRRNRAEFTEELRRNRAELREEIRRGNAQLLAALNGHTHDPDTGAAVFHEVPTAADDD